jgi:hypothetical protein
MSDRSCACFSPQPSLTASTVWYYPERVPAVEFLVAATGQSDSTEKGGDLVWANKIVDSLVSVTAFVVVPLQFVSTLLLGCLVTITFGALLLPISFLWMVLFLWPLLWLSRLWDKVSLLRIPCGIVGIPLAVLGNAYTAMMPSMGDTKSRVSKLLICQTWPFSQQFMAYTAGKLRSHPELDAILNRLASRDRAIYEYLANLEQSS